MAYLLPVIRHLAGVQPRIARERGTCALVVVPTRELAQQTNAVADALLKRFVWLVRVVGARSMVGVEGAMGMVGGAGVAGVKCAVGVVGDGLRCLLLQRLRWSRGW